MRTSILINRQGAGGDVLMTTPIVRKLYYDYNGDCDIDYFVGAQSREYIENNPYIRKIYTGLPDHETAETYDRIVDLDLVYENNPKMHAIDAYADHTFGNHDFDRSVELYATDADIKRVVELTEPIGKYVVLHQRRFPWPSRNIPEDFWRAVIKELLSKTDVAVVQIGALTEPAFSGSDRLIDARGTFNIPQLKELIAGSALYLGVDSGPAHVASATETDMLVLYTSVREEYRRPLRTAGRFVPVAADIDCYGCHSLNPAPCTTFICNRGDIECVNRFNPQAVADQAITLLKE